MNSRAGLEVEGVDGGLSSEDAARGEAVRNLSESSTTAGAWRHVERMIEKRAAELDTRAAQLDARERELANREANAADRLLQAEIVARQAGAKLLEEATTRAAGIIRAAVDEAGQLGQKAAVDAGAIRQAAQDHLVSGIALADAARLPPVVPPSGGQMLIKLGETLINRAASAFENLMATNPEAGARLAQRITETAADTGGEPDATAPSAESPTFGQVARAVEALGQQAVGEFLIARGLSSIDDLSVNDAAALVRQAAELSGGNRAGQ